MKDVVHSILDHIDDMTVCRQIEEIHKSANNREFYIAMMVNFLIDMYSKKKDQYQDTIKECLLFDDIETKAPRQWAQIMKFVDRHKDRSISKSIIKRMSKEQIKDLKDNYPELDSIIKEYS